MTKQNTEQLPAGIYQHYKDNEYKVFGVAHFLAKDDSGRPELMRFTVAIFAGTEYLPHEEKCFLHVYKQADGSLVYHDLNALPLSQNGYVIYQPTYGDRFYTYRTHDEFIEEVQPGLRRFTFLRSIGTDE